MSESEKNERALEKLLERMDRHDVILFVGAGSSKRAAYPLWEELVCQLRDRMQDEVGQDLSKHDQETKDLLWEAQRIVKQYNARYKEVLSEIFYPRPPKPFHIRLMQLPFHRYITVNYDSLLEKAARVVTNTTQPAKPSAQGSGGLETPDKFTDTLNYYDGQLLTEYIRDFRAPSSKYIFHLHGSEQDWSKIVLTEEDYVKFYGEENPIRNLLWMMVATYSILFVGFGISDWDFLLLFRLVHNRMVLKQPNHFALIPYSKRDGDRRTKRIYLNEKYGIEPVFYDIVERKVSDKQIVDCFETGLDGLMDVISERYHLETYEHHLIPDTYVLPKEDGGLAEARRLLEAQMDRRFGKRGR
jgi:hypothetical protein